MRVTRVRQIPPGRHGAAPVTIVTAGATGMTALGYWFVEGDPPRLGPSLINELADFREAAEPDSSLCHAGSRQDHRHLSDPFAEIAAVTREDSFMG